jgi:hypothetical protein
MIKAKELRIGNRIYEIQGVYDSDNDCFNFNDDDKVEVLVNLDTLKQLSVIHGHDYEVFEPIPLTSEILERYGFEKCYNSPYTLRYEYALNPKIGAGWNLVNNHFSVRYISENFTHIKYLHQLQNLYFALTGEELEIKELEDATV